MLTEQLKKPITISNITRDPYETDDFLFENDQLTLTHKITVFAGPNGYGKTSLITILKESLEQSGAAPFANNSRSRNMSHLLSSKTDEPIENTATIGFMSYDSHNDDYSQSLSSSLFNENLLMASLQMQSSEGENKLILLAHLFDNAQLIAKEHPNIHQLILFIDGIDSGMSIDKLNFIMDTLSVKIKQVEDLNPNLELCLVFTTNNYELVRNLPTIDPITFQKLDYYDYEEFRTDMIQKANRNKNR